MPGKYRTRFVWLPEVTHIESTYGEREKRDSQGDPAELWGELVETDGHETKIAETVVSQASCTIKLRGIVAVKARDTLLRKSTGDEFILEGVSFVYEPQEKRETVCRAIRQKRRDGR